MFIECLSQELAVCPHAEVEGFLAQAPQLWHVVSIREPDHPVPLFEHALGAHEAVFSDVFSSEGQGPQAAHLAGILRYVERTAGRPLLIHCWAGRSRSTAVALVVVVKKLWDQGMDGAGLVRTAIDALLMLRPMATPNHLVLRLGLEVFLPVALAKTLTKALMGEPRIERNFAEWRMSLLNAEG